MHPLPLEPRFFVFRTTPRNRDSMQEAVAHARLWNATACARGTDRPTSALHSHWSALHPADLCRNTQLIGVNRLHASWPTPERWG
jgi:hypothetical protein